MVCLCPVPVCQAFLSQSLFQVPFKIDDHGGVPRFAGSLLLLGWLLTRTFNQCWTNHRLNTCFPIIQKSTFSGWMLKLLGRSLFCIRMSFLWARGGFGARRWPNPPFAQITPSYNEVLQNLLPKWVLANSSPHLRQFSTICTVDVHQIHVGSLLSINSCSCCVLCKACQHLYSAGPVAFGTFGDDIEIRP